MSTLIDPNLIDPNPDQPKTRIEFSFADIADLESVKELGFIYNPQVRVNPSNPKRYQMVAGWRRRASWMHYRAGELMPVDVVECSDQEMFQKMVIENAQRLNLNVIQKISLLERAIKQFGMNQLDAGKLIGLQSQSAVSNLLGIGKLPADVKTLIADGKIAERNARALRTIEKLDASKTTQIAKDSISAENPEQFIDDAIEELLESKGCDLEFAPFELDWPEKAMPLVPSINGVNELRACKGCPYYFTRDNAHLCGNKACYAVKSDYVMPEHIAAVAKKLGIAVVANDEKTVVVYDDNRHDDYRLEQSLSKLIKQKASILRLAHSKGDVDHGWGRERYLGSRHVALVTTDMSAIKAWLASSNEQKKETVKEDRAEVKATETEAQKKKRLEREREEEIERREERAAFNKEKHDVLWLLAHVAPIVAEQIHVSGPAFLAFAAENIINGRSVPINFSDINSHEYALDNKIDQLNGDEKLRAIKEHMVYVVLTSAIATHGDKPEDVYQFGDVCERIEEICTESDIENTDAERFGVKLPKDWNKPPIHHTPFNCWHCGTFAPGEKLTKRDVEEFGWIDNFENAHAGGGVFCCTEHEKAHKPGSAKISKDAKPSKRK